MPIAIEVAKVRGWWYANFPWTDCRDMPLPPAGEKNTPVVVAEGTRRDFLDDISEYARTTRKKILADLKREQKKKRRGKR